MTEPIFYAVDDAYVPALAVSIQSLIAHTTPDKQYAIVILNRGLHFENEARLRSMATGNVSIELVPMAQQIAACLTDTGNKLRADYFTLTIYYRLFIAEMFPQYDKALYLDADTLLRGDVADLLATDVQGKLMAAAVDPLIANDPLLARYAEHSVGVPSVDYVNSGVLVMNLKAMRDLDFASHFTSLLQIYKFKSIAPDQDYINAIAHDRLVHITSEWNMQEETPDGDAKLVHYNLFKKPWHYRDVPYADEFWQHAAQTPFSDQLRGQLAAYSAADVAADETHMTQMVAHAGDITDDAGSFGVIQRTQKAVRL
ncbi:MAG: glycosyltransferase family 8 protein [Lacticaseibacillus songhuajiangensis]|jgi:lipopolysaccharide biosynthesis glycosyltransferase|nr:glycosyltransferase family 8 protein [Lacticaseibacillus songhuajiangensis]